MSTTSKCNPERMNVQRLFARLFALAGGAFWTVAFVVTELGWVHDTPMISARNALLPLALTIVTLAVGWYYERIVGIALIAGLAAVTVWGVTGAWEAGVWGLMGATLMAPMAISAALFLMAGSMQRVCTLELRTAAA